MDSVNRHQPEVNRIDLSGEDAVNKIRELVDNAKSCFFCTNIRSAQPFDTRPMTVQQVDDEGNLWFLSADDSHKNEELEENPFVRLLFQGGSHSNFLDLQGRAKVTRDKEKIHELWEPIAKAWFTEGKEDPRITVIRVKPDKGYYWDTKHGEVIAFSKQLVSAVTGQAMDDSVEGTLNPRG